MNEEQSFIRRDLWITRLYYFVMLGGGGFINPFLNLFYIRQGLNGSQIGWVIALGSAVSLLFAPLWTEWSARSRHPRLLLSASLCLTALVTVWLGQQHAFLFLALVASLRPLVGAGISPLSDALAVRVTGATRSGFGSVRVWGSIGWAFIVLLGGFLTQRLGLWAAFNANAATLVVSALLIFLISLPIAPSSRAPASFRKGLRKVAGHIFHTPALLGLGLMLIIIGMANSGVQQFENVYLDQLGARESLIGVANMVGSVVEIPGMFWADRLVRRHGSARVLLAGLVMFALLRLFIFIVPSIATIIAARAVWGIAFSFYTVALVRYIVDYTPAEQTGTALAIYTVTLSSLIGIVATPLSGRAFDLFGTHWLYAISLLGYLLGWGAIRLAQSRQARPVSSPVVLEPETGKAR